MPAGRSTVNVGDLAQASLEQSSHPHRRLTQGPVSGARVGKGGTAQRRKEKVHWGRESELSERKGLSCWGWAVGCGRRALGWFCLQPDLELRQVKTKLIVN